MVLLVTFLLGVTNAGCGLGALTLKNAQGNYNEAMKCIDEEELLLNLVRLRYNDSPYLLDISSITAQYELQGQLGAVPFSSPQSSNGLFRNFSRILPGGQVVGGARPTFSLVPVNDPRVYRSFLKPMSVEDLVFFAGTSWPASTIFRLWAGYVNCVPNAVSASGPTRDSIPDFERFQAGMYLLQVMKERDWCTFATEEKVVELGSPLPETSITTAASLDAARYGYEYRKKDDQTWVLVQRRKDTVLKINPQSLAEPEVRQFCDMFHLQQGLLAYPLSVQGAQPYSREQPPLKCAALNIVPRSGIQVLYYLSHGVEVPVEHLGCGLASATVGPGGEVFDWQQVTRGLLTIHHARQLGRPKQAHVAVKYHDYWFYISNDDAASKSTFALMLLLVRIDLGLESGAQRSPILTLPVGP